MATVNCARTTGLVALSTTTVDTINLSDTVGKVNVLNYSGTADLTVTVAVGATGGALGSATTPVAGAAETYTVPQGMALDIPTTSKVPFLTQVKVLGNGNTYQVAAV